MTIEQDNITPTTLPREHAPEQAARPIHTPSGTGRILGRAALATAAGLFVAFLTLPIVALLLRVPVADIATYAARPIVRDALLLSLGTTLVSLGLMLALGTPLAYLMARYRFRGKRLLETLVDVPLVMPPAVAGIALLLAFGRRGLLGPALEGVGLDLAFSTAAVVLAQTFVASPFYIKAARAAFQGVPRELEESAAVEGAGEWSRFRHVLLPLAVPGIAGGAVMAWARALGEFGATILFAGNFEGRTQTMPLAIYTALESDLNAAITLAALLVVASFVLLIAFRLLSGKRVDVVGMGE
jgi:molybdate transport system permease protein